MRASGGQFARDHRQRDATPEKTKMTFEEEEDDRADEPPVVREPDED